MPRLDPASWIWYLSVVWPWRTYFIWPWVSPGIRCHSHFLRPNAYKANPGILAPVDADCVLVCLLVLTEAKVSAITSMSENWSSGISSKSLRFPVKKLVGRLEKPHTFLRCTQGTRSACWGISQQRPKYLGRPWEQPPHNKWCLSSWPPPTARGQSHTLYPFYT